MSADSSILKSENSGWASHFNAFTTSSLEEVIARLTAFVRDSTPEEIRAWKGSIPGLQEQSRRSIDVRSDRVRYGAILEYQMPDGPHRVDAILLLAGAVLVLEFKGDGNWQPRYLEQAADYARRLYWWHACCGDSGTRVHTVLVSYGQEGTEESREFSTLTNLSNLADVIEKFDRAGEGEVIPVSDFVRPGVIQPSMSLVQAARRFSEIMSFRR